METLQLLSVFVVNVVLLALLPGPDNIFVAIQSISYGKKQGIVTVLGLLTGCLFHTTLVAAGVSAILKNNPIIYTILIVFGALYLFYLAYSVYSSEIHIDLSKSTEGRKTLGQLYRQGIVMNVLNPKVGLFFLAFFPGFLFSDSLSVFWQFVVLGLLFTLITLIVFGGIALGAGTLKSIIETNPKANYYLKWIQFTVFIALGIFILASHNY
jgi:threonine/homoserine/homoserine lactone efflux protein